MTTPSYQLDSVCVALIERLEAARRTWQGDPDAARAGLTRVAGESLQRVLEEEAEVLGEPGYAETTRHEVMETFLPRYLRLAVDQNALEEQGYRAWRRGDLVARAVGTGVALSVCLVAVRLVHHPLALSTFGLALMVPFLPELRAYWYGRRYRALLQQAVDDMARIQSNLDRFPGSVQSLRASTPETASPLEGTDPKVRAARAHQRETPP